MLLSIITINYNNSSGLKKTIDSVVNQLFKNFQYIIIDGGSTDGSVELIKGYETNIDYWVSEPDSGIYNAMNKGLAKATGEYILMINSGDHFVNNEVLDRVFKTPDLKDIFYGDILWNDNGNKYTQVFPAKLTFNFFRTNSLGHQATFVRKKVHDIVGLYDQHHEIISDWKFLTLAICKYNIPYCHIALVIAECGRDGISCLPENLDKIAIERNDVLQESFSVYMSDYKQMDNLEDHLNRLRRNFVIRLQREIKSLFTKKR